MKQGYAHIAIVLDRSGSMDAIRADTIGGFNAFIEEQKKVPGEATLTLTQFDHEYEVVKDFIVLADMPLLNEKTYVPRGMTALLDAIGRTIVTVGEKLDAMDEEGRPDKVIFVILTDGYENNSKEYKKAKIAEMVKHQTKTYDWQFVFLGANMDAIHEGAGMGMAAGQSMTYDPNNIQAAFNVTGQNVSAYRTGVRDNLSYTDKDREDAVKQ